MGVSSRLTDNVFLSTPSARRATAFEGCVEDAEEFLSTPSARRATVLIRMSFACTKDFYPRPPRGGRRPPPQTGGKGCCISIHALREEGDRMDRISLSYFALFLSTPSARRATCRSVQISNLHIQFLSTPSARRATGQIRVDGRAGHISIHALREEGDGTDQWHQHQHCISIHALREEGDQGFYFSRTGATYFYPRPPRGGRRNAKGNRVRSFRHFYPRPPRGGRLSHCHGLRWPSLYFYPRPPRGGRPVVNDPAEKPELISIHALREESDFCAVNRRLQQRISIHALREEGDWTITGTRFPRPYFYPRPPRGGRLSEPKRRPRLSNFYPRPPRGGRPGEDY